MGWKSMQESDFSERTWEQEITGHPEHVSVCVLILVEVDKIIIIVPSNFIHYVFLLVVNTVRNWTHDVEFGADKRSGMLI